MTTMPPMPAMTDAELAEYRKEPPPLGRCVCGRHAWTADEHGNPMHACCARLGQDCEACDVSDTLDRQNVRVRQWARATVERPRVD